MITKLARSVGGRFFVACSLAIGTGLSVGADEADGAGPPALRLASRVMPSELESVADGIVGAGPTALPDGKVRIAIARTSGGDDKERALLSDLAEAVQTRWKHLVGATPDEVAAAAKRLLYGPVDLETRSEARAGVMRALQVSHLVLLSAKIADDRVEISSRFALAGSDETTERRWDVEKDDPLRIYLGEPVPAYVYFTAPEQSELFIDGEQVGVGTGKQRLLRVAQGRHELRVSKPGYRPYTTSFTVHEGQRIKMAARERNNSTAPVGAMLASAVIPGLGVVMYGTPHTTGNKYTTSDGVAALGALGFYAFGSAWLIDELRGKDFTTQQSRQRTRDIKRIELGLAAGSYLVNVLASLAVGMDFAAKNKQLVKGSVASATPEEGPACRPLLGYWSSGSTESTSAQAGIAIRF